jgi:uncharacterized protein (TIGR02301 family)
MTYPIPTHASAGLVAVRCTILVAGFAWAGAILTAGAHPAAAQVSGPPGGIATRTPGVEVKPYDDKLLRLAEVLGAVHYLRELCGANEGQIWRERMRDLIDSEGSSPVRKARLTKGFNQGYTSYSRTYRACTPSAQTAANRFMSEGFQIADTLVKTIP